MVTARQQLVVYTKPFSDTVEGIPLSYPVGRVASALFLFAVAGLAVAIAWQLRLVTGRESKNADEADNP